MNRVNRETLCSPDVYPIYFERITKNLKIPVWIAAVSAGAVMGIAFAFTYHCSPPASQSLIG